MVVMEVRERNDDRASLSNFHILEAASSINDDLDIRRADLEACCVTAKSREVSTGYGNRSSHAMECHPDHAFTPSSMQEVTAFKNKTESVFSFSPFDTTYHKEKTIRNSSVFKFSAGFFQLMGFGLPFPHMKF